MANADASFGLKLIGHKSGSPFNALIKKCYIASSYGTALYQGDPVKFSGTSNTAAVSSGLEVHDIGCLPGIEKCAAGSGNVVAGVIVGFEPIVRSATAPYNPASTERVALVCVDPDAKYLIQADGSVAASDVLANANLIFTNAGSTSTGQSGVELDTSSMTTTAAYQLKILGFSKVYGRNAVGNWAVLEVGINNHYLSASTAGL